MSTAQAYYKILHSLGSAAGHSSSDINTALMHAGWAGGKLTYRAARVAAKGLGLAASAFKKALRTPTPAKSLEAAPSPETDTIMSEDRHLKRKLSLIGANDDSDGDEENFMALGPSGGRRSAGQETQIINHVPEKPWPYGATYTTHMRTVFDGTIKTLPNSITDIKHWSIRPTSIYSIYGHTVPVGYAATTAGNLSSEVSAGKYSGMAFGSQPIPAYRPLMEQIYQKYAVLECRYKIIVTLNTPANYNNWVVGLMKQGIDSPPTMICSDFFSMPGMEKQRLKAPAEGVGEEHSVVFKGVYRPGDYGEDVVTEALAETWTAVAKNAAGATPSVQELLSIYICPASNSLRSTTPDFYIRWDLDYIVQFKGPYSAFQYQTENDTKWDVTYPKIYARYP